MPGKPDESTDVKLVKRKCVFCGKITYYPCFNKKDADICKRPMIGKFLLDLWNK